MKVKIAFNPNSTSTASFSYQFQLSFHCWRVNTSGNCAITKRTRRSEEKVEKLNDKFSQQEQKRNSKKFYILHNDYNTGVLQQSGCFYYRGYGICWKSANWKTTSFLSGYQAHFSAAQSKTFQINQREIGGN